MFFITGIFISLFIYFVSIDHCLPKIVYSNNVIFELSFTDYNDFLIIAYKEDSSSNYTYKRFSINKSNELKNYSIKLPCEYEPSLLLFFGESHPVSFSVANLIVNNKLVEPIVIAKELNQLGYKVEIQQSVVHATPKENSEFGALDLHRLSDNFVYYSQEDIYNFNNQDLTLRMIYLIFIIILVMIFMRMILKFSRIKINTKFGLVYLIFLYFATFVLSFVMNYKNDIVKDFVGILYILKNYFSILLFPIVCVFYGHKQNLIIKISLFGIAFTFLFFVGIDHFIHTIFGNRFLFDYIGKFGANIKDGFPFIASYLSDYSGLCYILSVSCFCGLFFIDITEFSIFVRIKNSIFPLFVLSLCALIIKNPIDKSMYFNVFQVNSIGLFTDGDYKREYKERTIRDIKQLGYTQKQGLNMKKNIIVVLVESLGCNVTELCGTDKNYSPYMKELAEDGIWFKNYYSNAYHTNGAIFSILTGYPLVASKQSSYTPYNEKLYQYDLIKNFKEYGYVTAYFSPAPPVMSKDKQLKMSKFDYLSFNTDIFYNSSKKNGVFGAASDEELFAKILHDVKISQKPFLYMTTTVSTHTPYITPLGTQNIESAYAYSDKVLKKFISELKKNNYFDNGIVVVTGDHVGWASTNNIKNSSINFEFHKVPLVIINGKDKGVIDDVSFSHTNLGVLLEYLMLPTYYQNKYQINPLLDRNSSEYIVHYDNVKINYVDVKHGNREDEIILDGDKTRFVGKSFSKEEQKFILEYLFWVRQ